MDRGRGPAAVLERWQEEGRQLGTREGAHYARLIGNTPLVDLDLRIGSRWRRIGVKLESFNPGGSIKDRTAYALLESLFASGRLLPGCTVVESTSGNLGVALAALCNDVEAGFVAVVDPKVPGRTLDRMRDHGAQIELVPDPDRGGGYLLSRLQRVQDILAGDPTAVWPNQYGNRANPRAHYEQTGPELLRQCSQPPDVLLAAVSTGGTLAGLGRYAKAVLPSTRVIGVDVPGSLVFGEREAPRLLNGIGSSRRSEFLHQGVVDGHEIVRDAEAIAACHVVRGMVGIGLGGSAGAVVAGCARYLRDHPEVEYAVCVAADGSGNYTDTVYRRAWLSQRGVDVQQAAGSLAFEQVR